MHFCLGPLLPWIFRKFFYLVLKIFWQIAILSMKYRWTYKDEECLLHRPANTRAHLYCGCWGRNMPPIGMQWCSGTIYLKHLHHTSAWGSLLWACWTAYFHQQCTRAEASVSGESALWLLTQIGSIQYDRWPWVWAFSHAAIDSSKDFLSKETLSFDLQAWHCTIPQAVQRAKFLRLVIHDVENPVTSLTRSLDDVPLITFKCHWNRTWNQSR